MIEHVSADVDDVENAAAGEGESVEAPDVDELEGRLHDLQSAMDQIQSGDLDAAERAIEALENRMGSARD